MKTCSRCGESLPETNFHMKGRGYRRPECKACFKAARPRTERGSLALQPRLKDKADYQRFYKYGITAADYDALVLQQAGTCAICGGADPGAPDWQTDHDHKTGKIRGLLCRPCNIAIGLMCDDISRMQRAIEYLNG
jgi:hypothetical protein